MTAMRSARIAACLICLGPGSAHVWAADDAGERALRQEQLQRRQQQEALQLRMRQQQRATQSRPATPRQEHSLEHARNEQRQQTLHYRQSIEPAATHPSDDRGTRQAKEAIQRMNAERESQREIPQPQPEPQIGK